MADFDDRDFEIIEDNAGEYDSEYDGEYDFEYDGEYDGEYDDDKGESAMAEMFDDIKEGASDAISRMATRTGILVIIAILLCVGVAITLYVLDRNKVYTGYTVVSTVKINNQSDYKFDLVSDGMIKYNSDGVTFMKDDTVIWEDPFDMRDPVCDVCEDYFAIADKNTNLIRIYNKNGTVKEIKASYPVTKVEVARQGVVAALLRDGDVSYIELYDREGEKLVSHKTLLAENGYPLNFSMSKDGKSFVTSDVTLSEGYMTTKIQFYDFSSETTGYDNNMVGEFDEYGDSLVPFVGFVNNNYAIAIGENLMTVYRVSGKPYIYRQVEIEGNIQKVFCSEEYVGMLIRDDGESAKPAEEETKAEDETKADDKDKKEESKEKSTNSESLYRLDVYRLNGTKRLSLDIDTDYSSMTFAGDNVLMYNDMDWKLFSIHGVKKYEGTFEEPIDGMVSLDNKRSFVIFTDDKVSTIRLK